jgi:hypothetical protein
VKRIRRAPRGHRILAFNGGSRFVAERWERTLRLSGLDPDADWRELEPGELLHESRKTQVYRVPFEGGCFYFKRYRLPPNRPRYYLLRPSPAAVEWFGLEAFRRIGINTPEVACCGEERTMGRLDNAYMVTVGVNEAVNLEKFAHDTWYSLPADRRSGVYRQISAKVLEQVRIAHANQLFHRDLYWRNILVYPDDAGGYGTCWIDCPRAVRSRFLRSRNRKLDFSCVSRGALNYLSRSQRFRFLRSAMAGESRQRVETMFRAIAAHHDRLRFPLKTVDLPSGSRTCAKRTPRP